jgi:tetratricopeptide (TPR) repeat protein
MPDADIHTLLNQGIAAARAGQRARARDLLRRVLEAAPDDARAWLWLGGVVEAPAAQIDCLERAVALDPENATMRQALRAARQRQAAALVEAAARDPGRARALLTEAVELDEENATAWWRLSQTVTTREDREICLENVLALDPDHGDAQVALRLLHQNYAAPPQAEIAPPAPEMTAWELFEDELRCPWCAAPTAFEDRRCLACGQRLWTRRRVVTRCSASYWILAGLEALFAVGGALLPLLLLTYAGMHLVPQATPFQLLPLYLGQQEAPPDVAARIFAAVPRTLFWFALIPGALSWGILASVLPRWEPLYPVAMALGGARALVGAGHLLLALTGGLGAAEAPGVSGAFLRFTRNGILAADVSVIAFSAIALILLVNLHDHFLVETRRTLLRVDRDVAGNAAGLWLRGREYVKQQRWAIGALHLRRTLALEDRLEAYLMLALAYAHLGLDEKAESTLDDARRRHPDAARIEEMAQLLARKNVPPPAPREVSGL